MAETSNPGEPFLERLGIRPDVQSFFKNHIKQTCEEVFFKYGNSFEHVTAQFHLIPTTEEIWTAGNFDLAKHIFICGSAMDAICWLHLHYHTYKTNLFFAAVGTNPTKSQIENLVQPNKQYHLVFSADALGSICDLKTASFIRKKPMRIISNETGFTVTFRSKYYQIGNLSLNAFEKAARFHFNVPVSKPKKHNTFYEQLKYGHNH